MNRTNKLLTVIGASAIIATAIGTGYVLFATPDEVASEIQNTQVVPETSQKQSEDTVTSGTASPYRDGTYTTTANYDVPRDTNTITVTITIKDGLIVSFSSESDYGDDESAMYINSFEAAAPSSIVGQSVDTSFSRIGAASLTTAGFEAALAKVKSEAGV